MQNSGLIGGKVEANSAAKSKGTLLIRKERNNNVFWAFSLRKALAKTSKEERIRSIQVVCMSPYVS